MLIKNNFSVTFLFFQIAGTPLKMFVTKILDRRNQKFFAKRPFF
jgi:hypothetical protein